MKHALLGLCALAALAIPWPSTLRAQTPLGTAFTYQGQLKSGGSPASGLHTMEFRLYDATAGGNQVGPTLTFDGVGNPQVSVTDGLFTVQLDFGAEYNGDRRWLDIAVSGTPLFPRQELTATPHARFSAAPWATSGANISKTNTGNVGIGTSTPAALLHVTTSGTPAVVAETTGAAGNAFALIGSSDSTAGRGVLGTVGASTGATYGVVGESDSGIGTGVRGWAKATTGQNYGVYGQTSSDAGTGVYGIALSNSGTNYGVYGATNSASGYAGYFLGGRSYFDGSLGIGTSDPLVKLHVAGGIDASLAAGGYLVNGLTTGVNLVIDNNEIIARNNGAASTLFINNEGGDVNIGNAASNVIIDGSLTIGTTTRYFAIPGACFQPESSNFDSYVKFSNYVYGANGLGSSNTFYAAVHLPEGAVVTGFEGDVQDNEPAGTRDITITLRRYDPAGGFNATAMASAETSGGSAGIQTIADNTISFATIDNSTYAYLVSCYIVTTGPADLLRLYRVRVRYTMTEPLP